MLILFSKYCPEITLRTGFDVQTTFLLTIFRLYKIPFTHECVQKDFSPTQTLPCIMINEALYGFEDCLEVLEKEFNTEKNLSVSQKSMQTSLLALLDGPIKQALDYELYYDEAIYQQFTRNQLAWVHPFPISYLLPLMERNDKIEELLAHHPVLNSQIIYSSASHAVSCILNYLESVADSPGKLKKSFVFGSNPSILDAALYAYSHVCVRLLEKCDHSRLSKLMKGLVHVHSSLEEDRLRKS